MVIVIPRTAAGPLRGVHSTGERGEDANGTARLRGDKDDPLVPDDVLVARQTAAVVVVAAIAARLQHLTTIAGAAAIFSQSLQLLLRRAAPVGAEGRRPHSIGVLVVVVGKVAIQMGNRLLILVEVAVAAAVAYAQAAAQVVHAAKGRLMFVLRMLTAKVSRHRRRRQLSISHRRLLGRAGAAGQLLIEAAVGTRKAGARLVHAKNRENGSLVSTNQNVCSSSKYSPVRSKQLSTLLLVSRLLAAVVQPREATAQADIAEVMLLLLLTLKAGHRRGGRDGRLDATATAHRQFPIEVH